jgi:CheY-like chemotaxis protein
MRNGGGNRGDFTVLAVDDEPFNLEILSEFLGEAGYRLVCAEDGKEAWQMLEAEPGRFDAVLLDRMMPEMNGLEVLLRIKQHPELNTLPVIMQTAKSSRQDILEGLQAGAYYYLTKPFEQDALLAIVDTAVIDYHRYRQLQDEASQVSQTLSLMDHGQFSFETLAEGQNLAMMLANACPEPSKVILGLSELVINAVEHGNLGISYEDKSEIHRTGNWEDEIRRRQLLPENRGKKVVVTYSRTKDIVTFHIKDQGSGFDWKKYEEISPERVFDSHGRGIALAKTISFDHLEYQGIGNEVVAALFINIDEEETRIAI